MLKVRPLLLLLLFLSIKALAQGNSHIDSLKQVLKNPQLNDSIKTYTYIDVIRYYKKKNEDSCKAYFKGLSDFAKSSRAPIALHKYHYLRASYFGLFIQPEEDAFEFIQGNLLEALRYSKMLNRPELEAVTYMRLTSESARLGREDQALDFAFEGEKVTIENNLPEDLAYIYGQIGKIYNLGYQKTELALQYLLKSDSVYESIHSQGLQRGFTFSFIGDVYKSLEDYSEAQNYQFKALSVFENAENKYQQNFIKGKLALLEKDQENYGQALNYVTEAVAFYQKNKYPLQEAVFLVIQSEVYSKMGQIDKALSVGQQAIDLSKKHNHKVGLLMALINQSKIFSSQNNFSESNQLALEAKNLALEMKSYAELKDIYELLFLNSEKLGDYKAALDYSKEYRIANDTLVARQNIVNTRKLEAQYKNVQQQQEIALLQSQNRLTQAQRKNQQILLWGIVIFSAIALTTLFLLYRNRKKTTKKLMELDAAKSTFFQNISHEFRTPLSLISGPIEKRLKDKSIDEEDRKELEMIHRNSNRLMDLINQILDISKIESKELQLSVSQGNLSSLLKSLASSFTYKAEQKHINYKVNVVTIENAWFDKDAVEKITVNLLSNAFKFTPEGGVVSLDVNHQNGKVIIEVENSGYNFSNDEIDSIFNRFTRIEGSSEEKGSGIGLSLVKELTQLLRGEIQVENASKDSIKFTVELPIVKSEFEVHEINSREDSLTNYSMQKELPINDKTDGFPLLLVVDDNEDIRTFIKNSLNVDFKIIEANDGKEGIQKAIEQIPDVIVSDIMMPNVNGIELCTQLKQDERTSHIPIVLLTAKVGEESQYEGFETGADDYVLKPFSIKLLKSRLNNLIKSRLQLRDRYSKEVILKPKDISINSFDEIFIEKVKEVLDHKITDDTFTIENFSEALHMSRMQLHRKLKALTGLSASEFLRTERLKLAVSLLKNESLNINEICYQTGFSNPSYFTKCFKETYGILPSEFRESL